MVYVDIQAHNFSLRKAIYAYGKNTVQIIKNIANQQGIWALTASGNQLEGLCH